METPLVQDSGSGTAASWLSTSIPVAGVVSFSLAVSTPPRTGPFCTSGCLSYPYAGGAEFVPRDFIWMYPAIVLVVLVVPFAAVISAGAPTRRKVWGPVALAFAAIAAALLVLDYGVQLAVVQPSLLTGQADNVSLLSQYNPHGVFIALEDVGYAAIGLSFLVMAALVDPTTRLGRTVARVFRLGGALTLFLLILLTALYRADLEYRFEVYGLGVCWLVLVANGIMLSVLFRRTP
jgi:hypothetical protein